MFYFVDGVVCSIADSSVIREGVARAEGGVKNGTSWGHFVFIWRLWHKRFLTALVASELQIHCLRDISAVHQ